MLKYEKIKDSFDPELRTKIVKSGWRAFGYVVIACATVITAFDVGYNHGVLVTNSIIDQSLTGDDCKELRKEVVNRVRKFCDKCNDL